MNNFFKIIIKQKNKLIYWSLSYMKMMRNLYLFSILLCVCGFICYHSLVFLIIEILCMIGLLRSHPASIEYRENKLINKDSNIALMAIKKDPLLLAIIKDPTYETQLEAVRQDGNLIRYIYNPCLEVCLAAVKKTGSALMHIENQTEEMCLFAIKNECNAFYYVNTQTIDICIRALIHEDLKNNGISPSGMGNNRSYLNVNIVPNPSHEKTLENLKAKKLIKSKMNTQFNS
jgi:hypothetical protein